MLAVIVVQIWSKHGHASRYWYSSGSSYIYQISGFIYGKFLIFALLLIFVYMQSISFLNLLMMTVTCTQ